MKILVTGGSGFIGHCLTQRLESSGYEVEIFDLTDGRDLRNSDQVNTAIKSVSAVFHLAAVADLNWARENPKDTMDINVGGTINVADACAKYNTPLHYASTCCVYGNQDTHPTSEVSLPRPAEIYAATKLAGEHIIEGYGLMYGLKYNLIRFATIYGPGMRPALGVHIFFDQALSEKSITVHGDGKQTRTLTYITDLVDGIMALFRSNKYIGTVNISAEQEISAIAMAKQIKKLTKSKSRIIHIDQRPGQTFREVIDSSKARENFGWKAKITFNEGLKKTFHWFKREYS